MVCTRFVEIGFLLGAGFDDHGPVAIAFDALAVYVHVSNGLARGFVQAFGHYNGTMGEGSTHCPAATWLKATRLASSKISVLFLDIVCYREERRIEGDLSEDHGQELRLKA